MRTLIRPLISGLPALGGGAFLKKLGASFSRDPPPPRGRGRSLVDPFFLVPFEERWRQGLASGP